MERLYVSVILQIETQSLLICPYNSLGDGVTYPQRCVDEDTDDLLGSRQRWAEDDEENDLTTGFTNNHTYRKFCYCSVNYHFTIFAFPKSNSDVIFSKSHPLTPTLILCLNL